MYNLKFELYDSAGLHGSIKMLFPGMVAMLCHSKKRTRGSTIEAYREKFGKPGVFGPLDKRING